MEFIKNNINTLFEKTVIEIDEELPVLFNAAKNSKGINKKLI